MPLTEKRLSLAFSCGRRGTAERWMRSRRAQSYSFHSVIRFHTRFFFERAPGKPKPFGFSRSEKLRSTVGALVYRVLSQKKMDKGQYPLSAKRKCHTNIPAANILTLLPAAGARKRGLFEKSPLLNPAKTFGQLTPNFRCVHPTDSASRTAGAPAAGGRRRRRWQKHKNPPAVSCRRVVL